MASKAHIWTHAFPVLKVRNDFITPAGKNVSKTKMKRLPSGNGSHSASKIRNVHERVRYGRSARKIALYAAQE
jgi:hypothetical protein